MVAGVRLLGRVALAEFHSHLGRNCPELVASFVASGGALSGGRHMAPDAVGMLRRAHDRSVTSNRVCAHVP